MNLPHNNRIAPHNHLEGISLFVVIVGGETHRPVTKKLCPTPRLSSSFSVFVSVANQSLKPRIPEDEVLTSVGVTSGGNLSSFSKAFSTAARSSYTTSCLIGFVVHAEPTSVVFLSKFLLHHDTNMTESRCLMLCALAFRRPGPTRRPLWRHC